VSGSNKEIQNDWFSAVEKLELAAEIDADNLHMVSEIGRSQILAIADEPCELDLSETKLFCR
jgi:hypothetical protein